MRCAFKKGHWHCSRWAMVESKFCWNHDPDTDRSHKAQPKRKPCLASFTVGDITVVCQSRGHHTKHRTALDNASIITWTIHAEGPRQMPIRS
jgi:hypothetical protein